MVTQSTKLTCVFHLAIFLCLISNFGCQSNMALEEPQQILQVVASLGRGGLGDRSFNDAAYAGLQEAQRKFGIEFETVVFLSQDETLESLRKFARQEYDLIIGVGFENGPIIKTLSEEFPDLNFAVIDVAIDGPNIASVSFREQEADFLMGVLAAMLSKDADKVGFVGGPMYVGMQRILSGFEQGVAYQNKDLEVVVDLASTYADPDEGRILALKQYEQGVNIIHNAAGRTGLGIIQASEETNRLTTGTSGDQRYLAPGHVVGNRPKRTDTAILLLVEEVTKGEFTSGNRALGLAESGFSLGPFDEDIVTTDMLARLEILKRQIIDGNITIIIPEE